jgi:hypothetical protein
MIKASVEKKDGRWVRVEEDNCPINDWEKGHSEYFIKNGLTEDLFYKFT